MTRKAKLEKALACPKDLYNYPWQDAAERESERLASLHAALLDAVEALEKFSEMRDFNSLKEALSKIDKVLGEGK